jgi:hypothetical protein
MQPGNGRQMSVDVGAVRRPVVNTQPAKEKLPIDGEEEFHCDFRERRALRRTQHPAHRSMSNVFDGYACIALGHLPLRSAHAAGSSACLELHSFVPRLLALSVG